MDINQKLLIGQKIKSCRNNKGLTQKQLAKITHSSQSTIQRIETGEIDIPDYLLSPLCEAVNINEKSLITLLELDNLSESIQKVIAIDSADDIDIAMLESAKNLHTHLDTKKRKLIKQIITALIVIIVIFTTVNIVSYALNRMYFFEWITQDKIVIHNEKDKNIARTIISDGFVEIGTTNQSKITITSPQSITIDDLKYNMPDIFIPSVLPEGTTQFDVQYDENKFYKKANISYIHDGSSFHITITKNLEKIDDANAIITVEAGSVERIININTSNFTTTLYICQSDFSFAFAAIDGIEYMFRYSFDTETLIDVVKNMIPIQAQKPLIQ